MIPGVPPATFLGEDPVDGGALRRPVLDRDQPTRAQQPPRRLLDDPDRVQPVAAARPHGHDAIGRDVGARAIAGDRERDRTVPRDGFASDHAIVAESDGRTLRVASWRP